MRLLGAQTTRPPAQPFDAVDAALGVVARRELFTPEEALELLRVVREGTDETPAAALIDEIVTRATASYSDHMILDRGRLVDPLLDIRLALGD